MNYSTGKLAFIVIAAVVLAFIAAWVMAGRYRAAMRRLMSAPGPDKGGGHPQRDAPDPAQSTLPPQPVSAALQRWVPPDGRRTSASNCRC